MSIDNYWQPISVVGQGGGSGKGKSTSTVSEASDNLKSNSYVDITYLLGEGEMQGAAVEGDILKSTYLDDTPIKNLDGTINFKDFQIDYRTGTLDQTPIKGFGRSDVGSVMNETQVGVTVQQATGAIVRTITSNTDLDAIAVRVLFPQLQNVTVEKGAQINSVSLKIEVAVDANPYITYINDTLTGKTTSGYEEQYIMDVPKGETFKIRVTRITPDSNNQGNQNDFIWQSYTQITYAKFSYPNSAIVRVRINAEQFSSVPRVTFRWKLKKIKIPHNYNPITRIYSGSFNGSLSYAWSDNPAWVFYDIVTNPVYGLGKYVDPTVIDVFSLYSIGQYCDELVPTGLPTGGTEPRHTINYYRDSQDDALTVLQEITAIFRGIFYWTEGKIFAICDRPQTPVKIFNAANVGVEYDGDGTMTKPPFVYQYTSKFTRNSRVAVKYSDPDNFHRDAYETHFDNEALLRYGENPTIITAVGCARQGQAKRAAIAYLLTNNYETKTVTFTTSSRGAFVRLGDVIEITDTLKALRRWGGRIVNTPSVDTITLDSPVTFTFGKVYTLTFEWITDSGALSVLTRSIVNPAPVLGSSTVSTVTLQSALPRTLISGSAWLLRENDVQPQQFWVANIVESTPYEFEITAIQHNPSKYDAIDFGEPLEQIKISPPIPRIVPKPWGINVTTIPIFVEGVYRYQISVSWEVPLWEAIPSPFIKRYDIEYQVGWGSQWIRHSSVESPLATFENLSEGVYTFRVRAIDTNNRESNWVETIGVNTTRPIPPDPVGNVTIRQMPSSNVVLTWSDSQIYPLGIKAYNIYVDGAFVQTVDANSKESKELSPRVGHTNDVTIIPVDLAGQQSINGLTTNISGSLVPPNPSGSISLHVQSSGRVTLEFTQTTPLPVNFAYYMIESYHNGVHKQLDITKNNYTQPFLTESGNTTYRVLMQNTFAINSIGGIEETLADPVTLAKPNGEVSKTLTKEGMVISWTDSNIYPAHFLGYAIYVDDLLIERTNIKQTKPFKMSTADHTITIKSYGARG